MKYVHVRRAQKHMATLFDLVISCTTQGALAAEEVLGEAHLRINRLEQELSEFLEDSPIARLNAAPVGIRVALPDSAMELLERAEQLRLATGGAFDCCVKSRGPGFPKVAWDRVRGEAWRVSPGTHVGFGAIGKGYALDKVREDLEKHGFRDYLLTAGGSSIVLSGFSAPGVPWSWAWSWEKEADGTPRGVQFEHSTGVPVALGVSGTHEQGAHLKDPRSGLAVVERKSSLIGHPRATEADALSTALFVAGWEKTFPLLAKLSDKPAMAVIDGDGVPRWNGFFQSLWGTPVSVFLFCLTFFVTATLRADDAAVDLSQMGMEDFTPYIFDRNKIWILLPLLSLILVLLHLKQKPKPQPKAIPKRKLERVK